MTLALAAGTATLVPASPASASRTPCDWAAGTLHCGSYVLTTHALPPPDQPATPTLWVTIEDPGIDPQLLDAATMALLSGYREMSLAADTSDPVRAAQHQDSALAADQQAIALLGPGQPTIRLQYVNPDDPRPHPWVQPAATEWTAGLRQLADRPPPNPWIQQAAALLVDAYHAIDGNA